MSRTKKIIAILAIAGAGIGIGASVAASGGTGHVGASAPRTWVHG